MKIALLIPSLHLGGSERNIVLLGEMLTESGCDVEVWLTGSDSREVATSLEVVAIARAGGKASKALAIVRRISGIRRNIGRYRPDCMISFLESSNIPALLASLLSRTPVIVSVRGNPQRFNWFYRVMTLILYRYAKSIVLPSREVANYLARHYLLRNTVCIPNIQASSPTSSVPLEQKMSGPMVAVGRLVPGKRFGEVIALAEHIGSVSDLVIVGDGPERRALEALAERSSIRVRFTGAVTPQDVRQFMDTASVLVSMSVSECWPNAIAEALAAGTPVVARDCNYGPREMITDGLNGFLIHSVEDITARRDMRTALSDPNAYAALCRNAKERARSWSREQILSLWLAQLSGISA